MEPFILAFIWVVLILSGLVVYFGIKGNKNGMRICVALISIIPWVVLFYFLSQRN